MGLVKSSVRIDCENMQRGNKRDASRRRKRRQRSEKTAARLIFLLILIPDLCCALLFVRLHGMSAKIDSMDMRLEQLTDAVAEEMNKNAAIGDASGDAADDGFSGVIEPAGAETLYESRTVSGPDAVVEQHKHMVYLTFDDGPSIYTDEILDILDSYDVKATFFVVGREDENSKAALKRIVDEGHTLGMHSYSHKYTDIYESVDAFSADFTKLQDYLYDVTGVRSRYYRFPGGSSNTVSTVDMREYAEYLADQGVTFFDWNISSGDSSSKKMSVDTLIANCTDDLEQWQTSIILMHDSVGKHTTVEALPAIIENILAMDDTVILPITDDTRPVQHIKVETDE